MKDDSELQMDDALLDDSTYSPNRRRIGSGKSKSLRILLGAILVLIFAGGIFYFLSKRPTGGEASLLQLKVTALEQKIVGLEQQLAELQGKVSTSGPDPTLIHRVDALVQKIEALEKREQRTTESKIKPSPSSKPAVSTEKRYHTVQKGETLSGISKNTGSAWRNSENRTTCLRTNRFVPGKSSWFRLTVSYHTAFDMKK